MSDNQEVYPEAAIVLGMSFTQVTVSATELIGVSLLKSLTGAGGHAIIGWAAGAPATEGQSQRVRSLVCIGLILRNALEPEQIQEWLREPNRHLQWVAPVALLGNEVDSEDADYAELAVLRAAAAYVREHQAGH